MRSLALAAALLLGSAALAATQHAPVLGVSAGERLDTGAGPAGGTELMSEVLPQVGYQMVSERRHLELAYDADFIHHLVAKNITVDHHAKLDYKELLTRRLTLKAEGFFYRVEDTATLPRFGVATVHSAALWSGVKATADYRLSETGTVEGGYDGEATRLFSGHLPLGTSHAAYVQGRSKLDERVELGLRYRFQLFTADSSPYAQAHAVMGSARFTTTRHSFVALEGGPALYQAGGAGTLTPNLRFEYGYGARGVDVGVVAGRDLVGAAGYATSVWADYLQVAAAWRINRSFSVMGGGGVFRNGLAPSAPVTAQGYGASVGGEWRIAKGWAAHLEYDRIAQVGVTDLAFGLSRNILTARLSWRTP